MKRRMTWAGLAGLTVATAVAIATAALPDLAHADGKPVKGAGKVKGTNSLYIVELAEPPVTAYTGGIRGLQATKPGKGQKLDPNHPAVLRYMEHLAARQDEVLAQVGGGRKTHGYGYVFNGFAAELTPAQADKLARMPGVLAVNKDEVRTLDTATTPSFLGMTGPNGFYAVSGATGENVIIGIIDGGVWPEHPSFSDRTGVNGNGTQDGKLDYQQIPGWNGKCTPGEEFNASHCNQKLIGARYYNAGWGGNEGIDAQLPWEFNSPRDYGGHGTHTATTAGGNANVAATGDAAVLGSISGIAPRARIASYKVCWETGAGGSCFTTDSVAAIDQAVADGVDVINFSISGSRTNFRDAVEIAFLFAADAGVFVAASAGNSGPTTATVAHPGPWLTTVAAGTHDRDGRGSITLGSGQTFSGASLANALPATPMINAASAGLPGADPAAVALCFAAEDNGGAPVLDPAKVAGKIVVCDRGVNARINKSLAVKQAGGVGMVLINTSVNSINADFHFVPTVHLQSTDRAAVQSYVATVANPTGSAGDDRAHCAGAVHSEFLVARPAAGRRRRPVEARSDRARTGHPGRRRAPRKRRPPVRHLQRYLDVEPARGRPGGAVQAVVSHVVADGDQVGADDHRRRRARRRHAGTEYQPGADLPPGCRSREPDARAEPGAGL